ncbi:MAG: DNA polymerase I [Schleiferiaceae bacterium]
MTPDNTDKKLFLLDAYALIFRAYFAFARNPRVTSKGIDTSAVFGFVTTLMDLLAKENPTHIAVVFDTKAKTVRHEEFPEYKANRDETPEAIKVAVPYITKILEGFRIPAIGVDGYEADDVIGTLAKKAEKEGYTTYMMTPDKDFGQLVSENIFMYKPGRSGNPPEVLGIPEVCEKFKIERVDQVIDFLGMMGDSVDNIPGLPGVGEKTAQKLLAQYGSLEETLAHADEIKGKLGEKIRDNKEMGILSKRLATIIIDAPVDFVESDMIREEMNEEALTEVFNELEFRTLSRKLFGTGPSAPSSGSAPKSPSAASQGSGSNQMDLFAAPAQAAAVEGEEAPSGFKDLSNTDHHYQWIKDKVALGFFVESLLKQKSVAFDTETTGLSVLHDELVGLSFSYAAGKAFYVHLPTDRAEATEWLGIMEPFFSNTSIEKIGQNIKFDLSILKQYGIEVAGPLFDTMIAHYLLQPDMRHNMDVLAETYLGYKTQSIEELIGKKGKNQKSMRDVEVEKIVEYAGEDADVTFQLKQYFEPQLAETGVDKVFREIEMPLINVLADMEMAGIALDVDGLNKYSTQLAGEIAELEEKIMGYAAAPFNIGSPKQLGEVLFDQLKLSDKPKKTKSGQYATSEDILVGLKGSHPIIESILDYRQIVKLKSTYVDALPTLVDSSTHRIHTTFNQTVAATGRLSSTAPNLQNIPIRTPRGQEVRKAFIAGGDNQTLLAADYSQIELRIIAAMSEDAEMIEAFKKGEDIHAATAAKIFDVPLDEVTREQRSNAKTVNFGIIYGVSAFGLSQQTNLSRTEAKETIESYFATYPGIKNYMDAQVASAREKGYVETIMGRRRYLKDINSRNAVVRGHSERNAINAPIQGSAADVIKIAMIHIHEAMKLKEMQSKMVLQVHDELVFDVVDSEMEDLTQLVIEKMEKAVSVSVPLVVDTGRGDNWLQAH